MRFYKKASPQIRTSVIISPEFYELAKKNLIRFSEAMRVGISVLLAEKGVTEYDNTLNIVRQLTIYKQKAGGYAQEFADLEEKYKLKKKLLDETEEKLDNI